MPFPLRFERHILSDWDAAKRLWDECSMFFGSHGFNRDETYALTMASSELLENAVKYGDWNRAPAEKITLAIELEKGSVTIEVQCPAADDDHVLRKLDEHIQWIRGFQSPFEAYVERLKRVSSGAHEGGDSGLGLIRVAYEGRCVLDFYVSAARRMAMSAVYRPGGMY
jgi:hypothetical protein